MHKFVANVTGLQVFYKHIKNDKFLVVFSILSEVSFQFLRQFFQLNKYLFQFYNALGIIPYAGDSAVNNMNNDFKILKLADFYCTSRHMTVHILKLSILSEGKIQCLIVKA